MIKLRDLCDKTHREERSAKYGVYGMKSVRLIALQSQHIPRCFIPLIPTQMASHYYILRFFFFKRRIYTFLIILLNNVQNCLVPVLT